MSALATAGPSPRALIYARVSSDPKNRGRSVAEQVEECTAWCGREGWDIVEVVEDNDRSASRHAKRKREGWPRVQQLLAQRSADIVVTWEASRAQRDLDAYVELRGLCAKHEVRWAYSGAVYDLNDRSDRFRTGLDALVAEDEAERTRERVQRAMRSNAAKGRPHGRRVYGYDRVYDPTTGELAGQVENPVEAAVIREMATRFAKGESGYAIANDLNKRGSRPPATRMHGEPVQALWSTERISRILSNATYVGLRTHRGPDGRVEVYPAKTWKPIIDQATWDQVQARLGDPARTTNRDRRDIAHLLSGIARCGRCGAKLYRGHDRTGRHTYMCRAGGGHLTRDKNALDAYVIASVLEYLAQPDIVEQWTAAADDPESRLAASRAAELRERLKSATDQFIAGKLTAGTLANVESELLPAIAEAERATRRAVVPGVVAEVAGPDAHKRWDDLTIVQQRELVQSLVDVVVLPARPGRQAFDPSFVRLDWRR